MGALVEKVVGRCTLVPLSPPLGLSPHRPLGMTAGILPRRKKFPTHGPWGRDVCKPAAGLTMMKRSATLAMVTQLDKVLGWLCGLCRPIIVPGCTRAELPQVAKGVRGQMEGPIRVTSPGK